MALYYVAHRLFAAHDRALGAQAAGRLAQRVGPEKVFLPFCDTDEENLVDERKGQRLFEMDCERLRGIDGMIAILHGPSLDDGVCMEIGFASARGVPVVILTTDFQTYGPSVNGPTFAFADPLIEMIATRVERAYRLAPDLAESSEDRFTDFRRRNVQPLEAAMDRATEALLAASSHPPDWFQPGRFAYFEPSPWMAGNEWRYLARRLREQGWTVHESSRFRAHGDTWSATHADWDALCRSSVAVVDARGPEMAPGSALMVGACTAVGRPVLAAYTPGWQTFAEGREPNWRNLMIQYALCGRFTNANELIAMTDAL